MKKISVFIALILILTAVLSIPTVMTSAISPSDPETTLGPGYTEDLDGEFSCDISKGEALTDLSKLGDVNGDGTLNIKDATLIQKHLIEKLALKKDYRNRADVNGDYKIDSLDVTSIQKVIVGIEHLRTK